LQWDKKWDVEIAATIGLVRLGDKNPREVRDLLEAMTTGGSELGDRLDFELFDALTWVHARDASRILETEITLTEPLETAKDVVALFKKQGLTLASTRPFRLSGRIVAGVTVTGRRLIEERLTPFGIYVEGMTVRLMDPAEAMPLWRKRVE
jgi:hypothetical protein